MGLIQAALGSAGGVLKDQWKEFFYCEAMDKDVMVTKGVKQSGKGSSNKGNDNIISNGSGIAVADGQCMIIVEQGKIVEVCAEPGEFTYDSSTEPSIFCGKLGENILATFKAIGKRFSYGGDTGKDQRVYYFNTKELLDNKFGTANPVPFRVVDSKIGLDLDVSLRCSGIYTYRISDPLLFYTNVCGNVEREYRRSELDATLKAEFVAALQPALAKLSDMELRPNQIIAHNNELRDAMKAELTAQWSELRGLSVVNVAVSNVTLPEEDQQAIKETQLEAQREARLSDPTLAGAAMIRAQADALKAAANNANGAMAGFMGYNMASGAMGGGVNAADLLAMGQQKQAAQPVADGWKCSCGAVNQGNFCANCGAGKPQPAAGWTCSCGAVNQGKFCANCGAKKPAGAPLYKCDKCGWTPEDPSNPPKFCPQCGDAFDDSDIQ